MIKPGISGASILIANYHAPEEKGTEEIIKVLEIFGIKTIIFQRDVFNPQLYFELLNLAAFGDLNRMTQFKSSESPTAQLLTYPVLMAHDVAGYKEVMVGEDQTQHLQYARKLLKKHGEFEIPTANIVVGRIKDLRHPENKMSKSNPDGCLFLDDTSDDLRKKIKKATANEAGLANLRFLYREFVSDEVPEMNSELKSRLSEALIEKIS